MPLSTRTTQASQVDFLDHVAPNVLVRLQWHVHTPGDWIALDDDTGKVLSVVVGQRPLAFGTYDLDAIVADAECHEAHDGRFCFTVSWGAGGIEAYGATVEEARAWLIRAIAEDIDEESSHV